MAVSPSGVSALSSIAQALFGRSNVSLSDKPAADYIAQATLSTASLGIAPLILALRGPKKVYDPFLQLKRLERELDKVDKGKPINQKKWSEAEQEFARKRVGRLRSQDNMFTVQDLEDLEKFALHEQLFQGLTARQILSVAAPRRLRHARQGKQRAGLVPETASAERLAALNSIPRAGDPPVGKVFTKQEVRKQFARQQEIARWARRTRPVSKQFIRNVSELSSERFYNDFNLDRAERLLADEVPKTLIPNQPAPISKPKQEIEDVSLTGVPTVFTDFSTGLGGLIDTLSGPAATNLGNTIANIIGATRQPSGGNMMQPFPVNAPMERIAIPNPVMPGGTTPVFGQFDLPGFDLAPQGSQRGGAPTSPFRTTASGNQVAQPFVQTRSSGRSEWFIPAGQPKTWTKANVKRRRSCRPR